MIVFLVALVVNWFVISFTPYRNMRLLLAPVGVAAFAAFWFLT